MFSGPVINARCPFKSFSGVGLRGLIFSFGYLRGLGLEVLIDAAVFFRSRVLTLNPKP